MKRAIKTHLRDVTAIVVLLVLSVVVAGYVLSHERFRFPLIQSSPFTLNAAFPTAQAVTPGQGQSVRISGVQVGLIGNVTLKNGQAIVQMQLDDKYKNLVHTNATALLRPKTGLKDMFIELQPGAKPAPVAKQGWTLPVSNTLPDINADEILSSLDGDTRNYLQLLVNGAGQGLKGKGGSELAQVFERFEPTHRDLARLNKAVAVRGTDLRQLVNSLQRLNTALSHNQGQIVRLVDASSTVFRAFASQDSNISRAIALLPGTLAQTTDTLNKVTTFANLLGPTAKNLLPAARALPAANAAVTALAKPSAPIVQNQIRPFVVAARPLVRNLKPAAQNLAAATPNVTKTFNVVKRFVNMLGHNPGDTEHGYLWWLAWLDHNARTLFSVQDANGDFRPLFLQASCATYTQLVDSLNQASGGLGSAFESVLNLTPILTTAGVCPTQAAANQADFQKYQAKKQSQANTPSSTAGNPAGGAASNAVGGAAKALAPFDPNLPVK
jgi:phospholipid/cholesterol/gamma-HCH transport system substrate-binding protein